jgi:hypothetical protein
MSRINRHRITFEAAVDAECVVLARLGQHTRAIAAKVGLTPSEVQYRILKAGGKGARRQFRDGKSTEFEWCMKAVSRRIKADIQESVVPKFAIKR